MLRVEGLAGLPHGQGEVEQLAHGVAEGEARLVGVLGAHTLVERPHRGIMLDGTQGGHVQVAADQVVTAWGHDHSFGSAGLAIAIDAAGGFDGKDAEMANQLAGLGEAVVADHLGSENGGGNFAEANDSVEVVGLGELSIGGNQQFFQGFVADVGILELAGQVADQFLSDRPGQRGDGRMRLFQQGGDVLMR